VSVVARERLGGWDLVALALAVTAFFVLFSIPMKLTANSDSTEYMTFSAAIRSGELFAPSVDQPLSRGLGTRTPGYPLLLAIAESVTPDTVVAVRVLHGLLAVLALLYVPIALRGEVPVVSSAVSVLFGQTLMQFYYTTAITEWACFNLLLTVFALSARAVDEPSLGRLSLLGFLCAYLILIRPAMIVVAAVPPLLALVQSRFGRVRALVAAAAPFVLILLWATFNLYRLGSFTLTPFSGMNVFGVATIVGTPEARPDDGPELAILIREVNARKLPPAGETLESPRMAALGTANIYNWNVHQIGEVVRRQNGWDWVLYNRILIEYAWRAIRSNPSGYVAYVAGELGKLSRTLAIFLPAILFASFWLWRGRHRGLAVGLLVVVAIHVLHIVLCALVEVVIPRYEDLTSYVVLTALLVSVGVLERLLPWNSRPPEAATT